METELVSVPRELLEVIMELEWKGPLALTAHMNLALILKQPQTALEYPSVDACRRIFKTVPNDRAYALINELTYWHEQGRYE
jgi:hypothetical protein